MPSPPPSKQAPSRAPRDAVLLSQPASPDINLRYWGFSAAAEEKAGGLLKALECIKLDECQGRALKDATARCVATHLLLDLRLSLCLSSLALSFWKVLDAYLCSFPSEDLPRSTINKRKWGMAGKNCASRRKPGRYRNYLALLQQTKRVQIARIV